MRTTCVLVAMLLVGCAKGGAATGDDAPIDAFVPRHDAHPQTVTPDASTSVADAPVTPIDASVMADAAALGPDASTDGTICTDNSTCTDSGECCITLGGPAGFCGPGTLIGSTCLPN